MAFAIHSNHIWTSAQNESFTKTNWTSELQIRGGIKDNSKMIFLISRQKHYCDPSLELSRQEGCNDGSQNMFLWTNMANYP